MRILLVSTYELGHQPLHVASPAGALTREGHEVRCVDLAVEMLEPASLAWAQAVACSVPMHTATRIALAACAGMRAIRPDIPICVYGLYAGLVEMSAPGLADLAVAGEYEPQLSRWASEFEDGLKGKPVALKEPNRTVVELGRGRFGLPARDLLPPLDSYAALSVFGERRLAGYVEASHGCAHRCRHCPVPVVYDGRTRVVSVDSVLADVAKLADMGARHVTFGDPDFLNGPHHAERMVRALNDAFPGLTFDVTAKVEHVLAHRELWPVFGDAGCLFVVSAFESTSPTVLDHLAKGHSAADEHEAVAVLRSAGIEPRPSLLPFTPWTTAQDIVELLDMVAVCDLVGNVDAVQYAIRLLVPPGSLLLESGALDGLLGPYDQEHLSWTWDAQDPRLDELALVIAGIAERAGSEGWSADEGYEAIRAETARALGYNGSMRRPESDPRLRSSMPADARPRLTEPWFCCAEPTTAQMRFAVLEGSVKGRAR